MTFLVPHHLYFISLLQLIKCQGMDSGEKCDALELTSEHLILYTNGFDKKNLLGDTQFGKLYRGIIPHDPNQAEAQAVTVKIWVDPDIYLLDPNDKKSRLEDEVYFLQHPSVKNHPNLVKLIGYSEKGEPLGVVYDLDPRDTLHNLLVEDTFTWLERIKVALGFARLLEFLHDHDFPYMVRNIDAAHVMIDQDANPILFDFGMLSGGIIGDMANNSSQRIWGSIGYTDFHLASVGGWSITRDVYSYGVLLVSLIAKRVVDKDMPEKTSVDSWAKKEYKPKKSFFKLQAKSSLVHKSFEEDPFYDARDGPKITKLAMSCLEFFPKKRPTMKGIVQSLQALHVVRSHGEAVGIKAISGDA
uniref:Protein kinase domain-containing protein n=1 Tax=Davidia involucrata TaxID=16924 RepID=A0A5B7BGM9_DAVIN